MNPEEVTRVYLTFSPPDVPNGNISAYHAAVYRNGKLVFSIDSLPLVSNPNNTMTAVIEGLKGGFNYSIRVLTSIYFYCLHTKCKSKWSFIQTQLC